MPLCPLYRGEWSQRSFGLFSCGVWSKTGCLAEESPAGKVSDGKNSLGLLFPASGTAVCVAWGAGECGLCSFVTCVVGFRWSSAVSREFRGVLNTQFFLKADEVRQSVEEGVKQVRAQQQLQQQQLQQLQQQHQQQVSVQHQVSQHPMQHVPQNAPKAQHAQQPHVGLSASGHANVGGGTAVVGSSNAWMDQGSSSSSSGGGAGMSGGGR